MLLLMRYLVASGLNEFWVIAVSYKRAQSLHTVTRGYRGKFGEYRVDVIVLIYVQIFCCGRNGEGREEVVICKSRHDREAGQCHDDILLIAFCKWFHLYTN